jgi:hypothetical protein
MIFIVQRITRDSCSQKYSKVELKLDCLGPSLHNIKSKHNFFFQTSKHWSERTPFEVTNFCTPISVTFFEYYKQWAPRRSTRDISKIILNRRMKIFRKYLSASFYVIDREAINKYSYWMINAVKTCWKAWFHYFRSRVRLYRICSQYNNTNRNNFVQDKFGQPVLHICICTIYPKKISWSALTLEH